MSLSSVLRQRRKELGMTLSQIAEMMGVAEATVQRWESGNIKTLRHNKINKLAQILNVTPAYLMGWEDEPSALPVQSDDMPLIQAAGRVAAHFDATPNEEYEYIPVPQEWIGRRRASEFFMAIVDGDSMYPHYHDGDMIFCVKCSDMGVSGRVGIILTGDGEATLKKIVYESGCNWIDLVPYNPEYKTKRLSGADLEKCRIVGRVLKVIRNVDEA